MEKINNVLWQARFEKKNNWLQSRKTLLKAIKEFPGEKKLYEELAELYSEKKLFKNAIDFFQKSLEIDKADENILFKLANNFMSLGEYKLAIFYYNQIVSFIPEALYNKAIALSRTGKTEKCIEVLENLLKYTPNSEYPYLFLIEQYLYQLEYDKALKTLSSAETIFGKKGKFFFLKGLAFTYKKKWLNAYIEFNNAIKLNYKNSNLFRLFGVTCENINKTEEAIEHLLYAIRLEPFNANSYLDLIKIYLAHNRVTEAYTIARHAKKIGPVAPVISSVFNKIQTIIKDKKK